MEEDARSRAISDIRLLPTRRAAADNIMARIRMLEDDAVALHGAGASSVPIRGGGSRHEDSMIRNLTARDKLKSQEDALRDVIEATERAIRTLKTQERIALIGRYIRGKTITEIMYELHISRAGAYRTLKTAESKIVVAMGYE